MTVSRSLLALTILGLLSTALTGIAYAQEEDPPGTGALIVNRPRTANGWYLTSAGDSILIQITGITEAGATGGVCSAGQTRILVAATNLGCFPVVGGNTPQVLFTVPPFTISCTLPVFYRGTTIYLSDNPPPDPSPDGGHLIYNIPQCTGISIPEFGGPMAVLVAAIPFAALAVLTKVQRRGWGSYFR